MPKILHLKLPFRHEPRERIMSKKGSQGVERTRWIRRRRREERDEQRACDDAERRRCRTPEEHVEILDIGVEISKLLGNCLEFLLRRLAVTLKSS